MLNCFFFQTVSISRGKEGNTNPVIWREIQAPWWFIYKPFLQGAGVPGQWPPGWPCGWAGNPVGIYKHFSPAVVVVAALARSTNCVESPKASGTALGCRVLGEEIRSISNLGIMEDQLCRSSQRRLGSCSNHLCTVRNKSSWKWFHRYYWLCLRRACRKVFGDSCLPAFPPMEKCLLIIHPPTQGALPRSRQRRQIHFTAESCRWGRTSSCRGCYSLSSHPPQSHNPYSIPASHQISQLEHPFCFSNPSLMDIDNLPSLHLDSKSLPAATTASRRSRQSSSFPPLSPASSTPHQCPCTRLKHIHCTFSIYP